jgi:hypothetical protein
MPAIHLIYDERDKLTVPADQLAYIGASYIVLGLPNDGVSAEEVPELSRELARLLLTQLAIPKDHAGG